jgi:hypothetical protein
MAIGGVPHYLKQIRGGGDVMCPQNLGRLFKINVNN